MEKSFKYYSIVENPLLGVWLLKGKLDEPRKCRCFKSYEPLKAEA